MIRSECNVFEDSSSMQKMSLMVEPIDVNMHAVKFRSIVDFLKLLFVVSELKY